MKASSEAVSNSDALKKIRETDDEAEKKIQPVTAYCLPPLRLPRLHRESAAVGASSRGSKRGTERYSTRCCKPLAVSLDRGHMYSPGT